MKIKEFKEMPSEKQIKYVNDILTKQKSPNNFYTEDFPVDYTWVFNYLLKHNIAPLEEEKIGKTKIYKFRKMTSKEIDNKKEIKKDLITKLNIEAEEKTYTNEGLCFGLLGGSILTMILLMNNIPWSMMCIPLGLLIGVSLGSTIKK